jgi:phospholipid/cholesterol/gamma-HCH transport system substrate-binding protein
VRSRAEIIIGLFSIVAFIILIIFTVNIQKFNIFTPKYELQVYFKQIKGLEVGAPVHVYGAAAGQVAKIGYVKGEYPVKVVLRIRKGVKIYSNAEIRVSIAGLIGETSIYIDAGTSDHRLLGSGDVIIGAETVDMYQVLRLAPSIIEDVAATILAVKSFVTDEKNREAFSGTLVSLDSITNRLDKMLGATSADISETAHNLREATESLNQVIARIDRMVTDTSTDLQESRSLMKETLTDIQSQSEAITAQINTILDKLDVTADDLHTIISQNRNQLAQLGDNLNKGTTQLNAILEKVDSGQGTVSLLINDPTPFYDLRDTLKAIKTLLLGKEEQVFDTAIPYERKP